MKNFLKPRRFAISSMTKRTPSRLMGSGVRLIARPALHLAVISDVTRTVSLAQDSVVPSTVSSVFAKRTANGSVVSIAADGPLRRAQNWHDSEGYHLVFPNAAPAASLRAASGVRVRRIGTSLEVLVQTGPGSKVSMHPAGNQVNLII